MKLETFIYKNEDTNESIFGFIKNQQDSSKGMINYDLSFEGDFKDYFKWIINDYDSYGKTKFDLLMLKKTKYLVYHFNDMLNSTGQPMIKIRHSKVTDDYLAAEEIQNQNWQYFIERVIEVCKYDKKNPKTFCLLRLRMWLWQKNLMKVFII